MLVIQTQPMEATRMMHHSFFVRLSGIISIDRQ